MSAPCSSVRLVIPGQPIPKGRPRCTCVRNGRPLKKPHVYPPKRTEEYEGSVRAVAELAVLRRQQLPAEPMALSLVAYMSRPKRLCRKCDPDGPMEHEGTEDLDNVIKAVTDGLQLGGLIPDDRYIKRIEAAMLYHGKGEQPRVELTLRLLEADELGVW